ncbi:hypothetical protein [Grimontia marina]|uniref:Uncharacterized protein n=1 Tax=Grimontia marina TaxID=646534 RepID=A0A128EUN7_9GAMM|nr:hypothetical protein [Grimontia marina]CZF77900.1 hypothetical protein GMA8713_00356 [Grimontia marina]
MTELASYEFGKVEGGFSTLGERALEAVLPQGITIQKFQSQLATGEYVLLNDSPVTPALKSTTNSMGDKVWQVNPAAESSFSPEAKSALTSRTKAKGFTSRSGSESKAPAEAPYTPEAKVEEKQEKPPQDYEYLFEVACSEEVLASEVGCQFALGKTPKEASIVSWETKLSETGTIFSAKTTDDTPRKLIAKVASAEKGVSNQPPVKLKPKGTDAVREAFIPVIPALQLGDRLGFPTEGYFYHFHEKKLVQEYKILGEGRWAFQATRSTPFSLNSEQGLNKYQGAILLYWKINSKVVIDQHLIYLDSPITIEQLGNVNDQWLSEHGVMIDIPTLLNAKKATTAAKKPYKPKTYNAPVDVVYDHKERLLTGSTLKAINNERLVESGLPVVNVKTWGEAKLAFDLGYCQIEETQPLEQFWGNLFSDETPTDIQELIKKYNEHLNNPARQGEIVVLPTAEPETEEEKSRLDALIEEAKAASKELGKLTDDAVATVNRHFELLDYYASETLKTVKEDGLPSDVYAHASLGVGAVASGVGKHLQNINGILLEVNDLYVSQVAIASRTGGVNYGPFIAERAALLRKLDGSFSALSKRNVKVPAYVQVKKNLRLSTKSIIHNADEIIAKGIVPNLGKRMANISKGVSASRGLGYVGLALGAASGANNIYDACSVNSQGECGKVATREVFGFAGGWGGGALGSSVATGGVLLLLGVAGVTAAPVVAVAAVGAFVVGGAAGGIAGTAAGKTVGDVLYEAVVDVGDWAGDVIEDIF